MFKIDLKIITTKRLPSFLRFNPQIKQSCFCPDFFFLIIKIEYLAQSNKLHFIKKKKSLWIRSRLFDTQKNTVITNVNKYTDEEETSEIR